MTNKLKIDLHNPSVIGVITKSKLRKYLTPWSFNKLIKGGKGEFIEEIVLDYLINVKKYTNIVPSQSQSSYDFHLKENKNVMIDIRRFGYNKDYKNSIFLGYTSVTKRMEYPWRHKALYLEKGGYLGAMAFDQQIFLYFLPASFLLLNHKGERVGIEKTLNWIAESYVSNSKKTKKLNCKSFMLKNGAKCIVK